MSVERGSSTIEVAAIQAPQDRYDVAILGGGLAGLTLAIQLKQTRPETSVLVLEKREGPAPLAAFKVGESTVPSGAHYFAEVVGMRDHLLNEQLRKCGLRFFLPHDGNRDITQRAEVGPATYPPHDNYQVDRGLFENKLAARARSLGAQIAQGARVREVTLGGDAHTIDFELFGNPARTSARWVVDAAGRAAFMKRKLGLSADCGHHINSSWFRLSGGLDLEDWGRNDPAWMGFMAQPGLRKFSTNHLLGEGYWVWLIPLSTGPISIGVCADPRYHPFDEMKDFESLLDWFRRHEPPLAASLENRLEDVEDFLRVQDFAYGVQQTYSPERWSLVGEAAAFADPFYSPGSDFICYGNTFTTDLVTRDLAGEDISERIDFYNDLYQRAFEHVVSRYRDTYPVFGNAGVCRNLLNWDLYSNHIGLVMLCIKNKLTDLEFMKSVDDDLNRLFRLNINMHKLFRDWNELEQLDASGIKFFPMVLQGLTGIVQEFPNDDALREQIRAHVRNSEAIAVNMFEEASRALAERPERDRPINPYVVGLDPERWEADGLFEGPGLSFEEAQRIVFPFDPAAMAAAGAGGPPPGFPPGGPPPGFPPGGPPPGFPPGGPPPGFPPGGPPPGFGGGPPPGFPPGGPPPGFPPGGPPPGFPPGGPPPGFPPGGPPPGFGGPPPGFPPGGPPPGFPPGGPPPGFPPGGPPPGFPPGSGPPPGFPPGGPPPGFPPGGPPPGFPPGGPPPGFPPGGGAPPEGQPDGPQPGTDEPPNEEES
jgi:flavin-dependent dehydrogenase